MGLERRTFLLQGCALSLGLASARALSAAREPVIGGACEGCDWVYEEMPSKLSSVARIAPTTEAGAPLAIEGAVQNASGAPVANVIVYAYHTNQGGIYPVARNRHGTLKGWAKTDSHGLYRFDTIRPGAYPGRNVPEHVHMHVIEPGAGTYYVDDLRFLDDPLLTGSNRRADGRAGNGLVMPVRRDGVWQARRDIVLGRDIPGYVERGRA
jgi:protocatechuate 3,4-dioxygenase beta subunit